MTQFDMEAVMEIEHEFGAKSKKPVDESAPKRAMSSFFLWANKVRPQVIKENSDSSLGEISKIMGKMWKQLSASDRAFFEARSDKDKKTYHAKMEKYKKTANYKKFQMKMLAWKIHETKKPFGRDPNAPKRGHSAYMLYGQSIRAKIVEENPEFSAAEVMKEQSEWWKALSATDRKPWIEKGEAEKAKYQKKLARYMKTNEYQTWVTNRDVYKQNMLIKRNKLMGIKKRRRSESKARSAKKQKRSRSRAARRSTSRRRASRRSRVPRSPKRSSRKSSRRSRKRVSRRSRTPKSSSRSTSRSPSRRRVTRKRSARRGRVKARK